MTPFEMSPDNPEGKHLIVRGKDTNMTPKKCVPMLDAITSGYIVSLYADVQVGRNPDGTPHISWLMDRDVFELHAPSAVLVQPPVGFSRVVFKFINTWVPSTPSGYSCLVTAPFGHRDLPFHAIPAVIDTDKSVVELSAPVWVREGFEGIVEAGTPMFQITPFKRENWKAEFEKLPENEYYYREQSGVRATIVNNYIKRYWSKKTYR